MLRIGFVPLDDRPCTKDFPNRIARIAQAEVLLPPIESLGSFLNSGQPSKIEEWLVHVAPNLDYLILSIDMLTYGGLIGSRTPQISKEKAFEHLSVLQKLKELNPKLKIYAWNVLMRISITVHDDQTAQYWEQMNRFSVLWAKAQEDALTEQEKAIFSTLQHEIPAVVRETYFQARRRNHQVNLHAISLVETGILDTLILCQEDAHSIGPHKLEQRILLQKINPEDLNTKIFLHPGADESGLNLMARAFCHHYKQMPSIDFAFFPEQARYSVPIFEDIPLGKSVISQSLACGLKVQKENPQLVAAVYGPTTTTEDLSVWQHREEQPVETSVFEELWAKITTSLQRETQTILCDVFIPNGSDPGLLQFLQGKDTSLLASYAGWNTAGNTIGTALAHGTIYSLAQTEGILNQAAQLEFMIERLIDDYAYQKLIREELGKLILQNPHWGTRHQLSKEGWEYLNSVVETRLQSWADTYLSQYNLPSVVVQAKLPWPRIFEVYVQVKLRKELNT